MNSPSIVSRTYATATVVDGIAERDINVYSIRLSKLLTLRSIAKDLASAIFNLMSGSPVDLAGSTTQREVDKEGNLTAYKEVQNPVGLPMLERLQAKKEEAIESITRLLLEEKNLAIVCDIIADSCRDEEGMTPAVLMNSSADNFLALAMGVIEANKSVFDPLMDLLSRKTPQAQETEDEDEAEKTTNTED